MDYKDIFRTIAPTAATLLGGPLAGMAVKFIADQIGVPATTADAVTTALSSLGETPEGRIKLAEIDAALRTHAIDSGIDLERLAAQNAADVNKTMQVEAASEHWPSYSWRPFCGFIFGTMFLGTYFVLPLLKMPVPVVPVEAWAAMGSVLGIASWFRGKAQADPANPATNKG